MRKKRKSGISRREFFGLGAAVGAAGAISGCASGGPEAIAPVGPRGAPLRLDINGRTFELEVEPRVTLLDALRDHARVGGAPLDLTGSKRVCDRASCGACTVLVDGRNVYACTILAVAAQGHRIRTVESLAQGTKLHPVQEEFIRCDGMMCGFCTPGFIMSAVALLEKNPKAERREMRRALDGNICRCGTQARALEAVERAAERM